MAIVDNRTALSGFETGDTPAQPDDLTGAAGGTADTEIFIEGSRSYGYYTTSTRDGLLYDAGSAQNWANNTFYLWVNCAVAGLLDTKANGGLAVRFCGATVSDWFEVNVAGSDDYPTAVSGGWVMLVIDVEKAKTASNRTNGTPPATNAIRYVGVTTITGGTMPRMADNTWLDKVWRLPQNTPGVLVEGQDTGSVDWDWTAILDWSEANAAGIARRDAGGAIAVNTPFRFGANDAVTHGFSSTNEIVLWQNWDVDASFYGIEVIGGSGTQSWTMGVKTGTGDDATGAQGGTIAAVSTGERFYFDADDANVDACNVYGVSFVHGDIFQLDDPAVSVISSLFVDCTEAFIQDCADFLRCQVIDPNTTDGNGFLQTNDMSDAVFCTFEFSDGHAIELTGTAVTPQTNKGNKFNGAYGGTAGDNLVANSGSTDAEIFNDLGQLVVFNGSDAADTPAFRNGVSATSDYENPVTHTVTGLLAGERVVWIRVSDEVELENQLQSGGSAAYTYSYVSDTDVYVSILSQDRKIKSPTVTLGNTDATLPASLETDPFFENP